LPLVLTTIPSETIFSFFNRTILQRECTKVLVGEPKQMNGLPSESTAIIEEFVTQFKKQFPQIEVIRVDERFTSKMAFQTMIDSGLKKKQRQNKALVDEIAATIMLQDYLLKFKIT
jgi:putative Holliday junction resolvase